VSRNEPFSGHCVATTPIGYEVIIGQETIVKYYGNSSRTKLIKTIQKIYWVG